MFQWYRPYDELPLSLAFNHKLRRYSQDSDGGRSSDAEEAPPTLAWNLPHTCIFQSDIVGFTSLTQRITPHQLVVGRCRLNLSNLC